MAGYVAAYGRCCAVETGGKPMDSPRRITNSGPTAGLPSKGCTVWNTALANMFSLNTETTDWRAGCGKSACPVRREGWSSNLHPYPYFIERWAQPSIVSFCFSAARHFHNERNERYQLKTRLTHRVVQAPRRRKTKRRGTVGGHWRKPLNPSAPAYSTLRGLKACPPSLRHCLQARDRRSENTPPE